MNNFYIPFELLQDPELKEYPKALLLYEEICYMYKQDIEFLSKKEELAQKLECSVAGIDFYLNILKRKNIDDEIKQILLNN